MTSQSRRTVSARQCARHHGRSLRTTEPSYPREGSAWSRLPGRPALNWLLLPLRPPGQEEGSTLNLIKLVNVTLEKLSSSGVFQGYKKKNQVFSNKRSPYAKKIYCRYSFRTNQICIPCLLLGRSTINIF